MYYPLFLFSRFLIFLIFLCVLSMIMIYFLYIYLYLFYAPGLYQILSNHRDFILQFRLGVESTD
eukprot:UN13597